MPPRLDVDQSAVRDHDSGPLLVLAGPGTGKTTTIVEAVAARLGGPRPLAPDEVLVLTFGRAAARELRGRIAARLTSVSLPTVATFHAFAWQFLRRHADPDTSASRLLSGPEQDLAVREMLAGHVEAGAPSWPETLRPALATGGMARELRSLMGAARGRGLEPDDFAALAQRNDQQDWTAAADFFEEYLQVLDMRGALDYSELIHRARALAQADPSLRGRYRAIYVDEFQDTDPGQVALLASLVTPTTALVAVGDPDQSIYRFRGADVRGILGFPDAFRDVDGEPAPTRVLTLSRRFGPEIRAVADAWISRVSLSPLPVSVARAHRRPACEGAPGTVELALFGSVAEQSTGLADLLRRAHLDQDSPMAWSDMAVLVRAGTEDIPRLQRAFVAAGIPVEVPASDLPLGQDPALAPLLIGLRLADRPEEVSVEEVTEFLCSPLVGLTPVDVRQIGRALRIADRVEAEEQHRPIRASANLLAALVAGEPDQLLSLTGELEEALRPVLQVLADMRAARTDRVYEQLWRLWALGGDGRRDGPIQGGRWAHQLWRSALAGGTSGRQADRVLDAVVALFALADRLPEGAGVTEFVSSLRHQQIPAARPDDGFWHRDAVRLMTVHRAKGGEWPMVIVVGMQQDRWPDLRPSSSLLRAERLGVDDIEDPLTRRQLLDDERRLAFVAATRARRRLVVSAVDSADPDLDQVSVFVDELRDEEDGESAGLAVPLDVVPTTEHLSEPALLASLRTAVTDETASPALRRAAAARLALLGDDGYVGYMSKARPDMWWGLRNTSISEVALLEAGVPAHLSATTVNGLADCPLRWFLDRKVRAAEGRNENLGYGSLVHALIAGTVEGELPAELPAMIEGLDRVWGEIPYEAGWRSRQKHTQAEAALARYLQWQQSQPSPPLASERQFAFPVASDTGGSVMHGAIDLIDGGDDGAARVVDFKTGSSIASKDAAEQSVQLGVYQLSLQFEDSDDSDPVQPGGGVFVYLDKDASGRPGHPDTRRQSPLTDPEPLLAAIRVAEETLREEAIVATPGDVCRTCAFRRVCPAQDEGIPGGSWSG